MGPAENSFPLRASGSPANSGRLLWGRNGFCKLSQQGFSGLSLLTGTSPLHLSVWGILFHLYLHPIWTHFFFLDKSSIPCCFPLLPLQFVNALCFSLSHFSSYFAFCFTGFQQKHRITHHNCACAPTKYLLESPEGQHPCESVLIGTFMLVLHNCSSAGKCKCVYHNGSVCAISACVPDKKTASY